MYNNRKRKDNWLAPSIQHKFDSHIKLVKRIKSRYLALESSI
ncbi:RRXRR domain-containing protein [Coleofasciculus sp. G1-WW12-02]